MLFISEITISHHHPQRGIYHTIIFRGAYISSSSSEGHISHHYLQRGIYRIIILRGAYIASSSSRES
jgi:hypothetical protein